MSSVASSARPTSRVVGVKRWDTDTLIGAGLLAAAFLSICFRWIIHQNHISMKLPEDWGHAWFIPLISGYLIWRVRDQVQWSQRETFWPALLPLCAGMVIYFFFIVGFANHMSQGFGLLIALIGLVLLILGPRQTAPVFLPIAYLVFAIYISDKIMWEITFWLKTIASSGSTVVLTVLGSIFGFEVRSQGTVIWVADHPMDVADACSGMRTVVAFLALGAAVCLISCRLWWQRVWLLMLAIPVAIVLNIVRVVTLGLLSMADPELASGQAHTLIGTILLLPGLGLFMLIVMALNRAVVDAPEGAPEAAPEGAAR